MNRDKPKLKYTINFRATEEMYKDLMKYLENVGKTVSIFMREITYDFIKLQRIVEKNGFKELKKAEVVDQHD